MRNTHPWDAAHRSYKKYRRVSSREEKLIRSTKNTARVKNLDHTITPEDIPIPANCPVLGITLTNIGKADTCPSVDRINSKGGYTPDNVRVISMRANRIKSDASLQELEAIVNYIKSN